MSSFLGGFFFSAWAKPLVIDSSKQMVNNFIALSILSMCSDSLGGWKDSFIESVK
jgi:hypothetical protein